MTFKEAIKYMIENKEFEKIIKNSKGKDKKSAKEIYSLLKDNKDYDLIPSIVLLSSIHSVSVLRDAIVIMDMPSPKKKS